MSARDIVLQLVITAQDLASNGLNRVRAGVTGIRESVSEALAPLRSFGALISAAIGIGGAKEIIDRSDAYTRLSNSLKAATGSEKEYMAAEQEVARISKDTRSSLETTAQLYARVNQNRKAMNLTEQESARLTELISKGMQLGGASASEYASATLQLTQAFGSGVLRGEEFNSVMEASPVLMQRLADGLGVAAGELRGLAEQGVLTSTIVAKALLSQADAIDTTYAKTNATVEQRFEQLGNAATLFVGRLNQQTGATAALGSGLKFLAENLDAVAALMGAAFAASIARGVQSTYQFAAASLAARDAARQQAIAAQQQQAATLAAAQSQVAAAQAAVNRTIAEQRLALQIVALMQAELGYGVTETELAAARTRSALAAQAATAATERYAIAQAALNAAQVPAAASVGLFGRALSFLTGPGGLILTAVASFGLLYSAFAKQKQPTDDLTQSTEQYAESLKKLSAAQTGVELDRLNQQLDEQKQRVAEAAAAIEQAASKERDWIVVTEDRGAILGKTNRIVSDAAEIERIRTVRQAELDTATAALTATEERRAVVMADLGQKQRQQADGSAKQAAQFVQQGIAMEKLSGDVEKLGKHQETLSKSEQGRLQSERDLAEAAGDLQRVEALNIEIAAKKAQAAQKQADLDTWSAALANAKVEAIQGEYKSYQTLSPVQEKTLETARRAAEEKGKEAEASRALAVYLETQAQRTRALNTAQEGLLQSAARFRAAQAESAAAAVLEARASVELAQAKRDEQGAAEALLTLRRAEAREAAASLTAQQAELAQLQFKRQQLINTAGGYERLTAAQRLEVGQLEQGIDTKRRDIAASETDLAIKEREARQAERMAGPIGELIRLYERKVKAAERETDAVERSYDSKLRDLEVEQKQAEAKGDTARAAEIGIKIKAVEAEKAQEAANIKKEELQADIDLLEAKKLDVLASEKSAQAKSEELAQIDAKIAKLKDLKDAEQDRADAAKAEVEKAKRNAEALKAQAAAAAEAERETRRMAAVVGYAAQSFDQLSEKGRAALAAINSDPLVKAAQTADELARATAQLVKGLDDAAAAEIRFAERLSDLQNKAAGVGAEADAARRELLAMAQGGASGISGITSAGQSAIQTLEGIRNSALEAKQALAQMADDYQRQILQARGEQRQLLELEHQENLRRLDELRQKEGQAGSNEYVQAKARAEELHRLKLKQLADEEAEKRRQEAESREPRPPAGGGGGSRPTGGSSGGAGGGGGSTITTTINMSLPNAITMDDRAADLLARRIKPVFDDIQRRLR